MNRPTTPGVHTRLEDPSMAPVVRTRPSGWQTPQYTVHPIHPCLTLLSVTPSERRLLPEVSPPSPSPPGSSYPPQASVSRPEPSFLLACVPETRLSRPPRDPSWLRGGTTQGLRGLGRRPRTPPLEPGRDVSPSSTRDFPLQRSRPTLPHPLSS